MEQMWSDGDPLIVVLTTVPQHLGYANRLAFCDLSVLITDAWIAFALSEESRTWMMTF